MSLPTATVPPAVATPPAESLAFVDTFSPHSPVPARRTKPKRRLGRRLAALLLVGGLGYAGVVYGPDLYDDYFAAEEEPEPAAPMAFPSVRAGGAEVRTATFVLEGLPSGSDATYTITVDFETWVSRVVIDRTDDSPDLEVLTFASDALVRRLDSSTWFQLDRGSFPFDQQLQRTDWIRAIDDLLPADRRSGVVIEESTQAMVGGVPTRHLVLTVDPTLLRVDPAEPDTMDPIADLTAAVDTDAAPAPVPADTIAPVTSSTSSLIGGTTTSEIATDGARTNDTTRVELWIDGQGLVRRSTGAEVLGAQNFTVLETTPDAWIPDYPDESQVGAMTAGALIELGL